MRDALRSLAGEAWTLPEAAWLSRQVAEQVLEAGLALGVSAGLPPRSAPPQWRQDPGPAGCAAA
jgi:hypothetical protein